MRLGWLSYCVSHSDPLTILQVFVPQLGMVMDFVMTVTIQLTQLTEYSLTMGIAVLLMHKIIGMRIVQHVNVLLTLQSKDFWMNARIFITFNLGIHIFPLFLSNTYLIF